MIASWDRAAVEALQHAHWGPANWFFELLSDWWVKSLVMLALALAADLAWRRFPFGVLLAAASYLIADGIATWLKGVFDRPRPSVADAAVHPLVAVPHSGSMPSGHATAAFAAAVGIGLVHPRLRWPLVALAALIAFSRVWLGVHYPSDVIVGAALGCAVALVLWQLGRAAGPGFRARRRIGA